MSIKKTSKTNSLQRIPRGEPQTMAELLQAHPDQFKGLKRGEIVTGKIVNITPKAVFLDIGAKTEGIVVEKEYTAVEDYIKQLQVGQEISAQIKSPETDSGQILLSLRRAIQESVWQKISDASKNNQPLEVKVREINRAGLMVDYQGIFGFIPNSHLSVKLLPNLNQQIGQNLKVKVIEFDPAERRLVLSERLISEADQMEKITQILKNAKMNQEYEGTISAILPFGLFVRIAIEKTEIDGLVHISEISWEKVEDLSQLFKVGEKIKVRLVGIDPKDNRVSLSIKQLTPDPWLEQVKKYPVDTHIKGKVSRLVAYGAFIEIESGLEGLIHISKIPAETKIDVGDSIDCFVEAIEPDKRRLSLGLVLKEKPIGYK